jgi:hypothetical protein
MIPVLLSLYMLVATLTALGVVYLTGLLGARLTQGDFSWVRYVAWLVGSAFGAVLMLAATTFAVFLTVAIALVLWVLLRAAADAQSTTLREKLGFVQLYAGLSLVEYGAMQHAGMLERTRASSAFTFVLHDYVGQLALPLSGLVARERSARAAADAVGTIADALASHWLLAVALTTFAVSAYVYTYFAEHATPLVGVELLPVPAVVSAIFSVAWLVAAVFPTTSMVGSWAALLAVFFTPFYLAEGIWVVYRFARGVRTRAFWTAVLACASLVSAFLAGLLTVVGLAFHLVRLRAFEPILGDVRRSASRPRLRTAAIASVAASATLGVLGAALGSATAKASPLLGTGPGMCGNLTLTPVKDGVRVDRPGGSFTIDAEEIALGAEGSLDAAAALCEGRHARLCTSDEWYVACVCTYPNESLVGSKTSTNDRLVYRLETDAASGATAGVKDLLGGRSEIVGPRTSGGGVLAAGGNDGVHDAFTVDCRYRAWLTDRALQSTAATHVGVRCCR